MAFIRWRSDGSQNFETIMKLQTNDWENSIWKKKYDVYVFQRIYQEDGTTPYSMIELDGDESTESLGRRY